jgi:hypothetical protein
MARRFLMVMLILSFASGTMLTGCSALQYFGLGGGTGTWITLAFQLGIPLVQLLLQGVLSGASTGG